MHTARESLALLEGITVETYGQQTPLKQLATRAAPDARLLTTQPWDKSTMGEIEKAIQISDLCITPINDGNIIRLQLPQTSADRREDLVKQLSKKTEECRVKIRNVRKEFHNEVRDAVKKKIVSEDFGEKLMATVQKVTDAFLAKAVTINDKKAGDILAI